MAISSQEKVYYLSYFSCLILNKMMASQPSCVQWLGACQLHYTPWIEVSVLSLSPPQGHIYTVLFWGEI